MFELRKIAQPRRCHVRHLSFEGSQWTKVLIADHHASSAVTLLEVEARLGASDPIRVAISLDATEVSLAAKPSRAPRSLSYFRSCCNQDTILRRSGKIGQAFPDVLMAGIEVPELNEAAALGCHSVMPCILTPILGNSQKELLG